MTIKLSTGLANFRLAGGSLQQALSGGKLKVYTGSQPANADAAPTGTLLCTYTDNAGGHTQEVRATGTVTLTGGSSGSVDAITVDGNEILGSAISYITSLTATAAAVVARINKNPRNTVIASSSGAVITLTAKPGWGAAANGWVVATTVTTITKTDVNIGSGVAGVSAVNGLRFGAAAAGTMVKDSTQTWSGVGAATGTAGWFRFEGPVADSGALDSSETQIRLDGNVGTSGANLNMTGTTTLASGATHTISEFSPTQPLTA